MGDMDDCNYRNHTNTIQSLGNMFGIMSLPYFTVSWRVRHIQNRTIRNHRISALAFPRTGKRNSKKIFMAINRRSNSIRALRFIDNNIGVIFS